MKKIVRAGLSAAAMIALSSCGGEADTAEGDDGDTMAEGDAMADGDAPAAGDATADGDAMADGGAMAEGEEGEAEDTAMAENEAAESGGSGNRISIGRDGVTAEVEGRTVNANLDDDVTVD